MFESFTKNGRSISRRYIGILRKNSYVAHSQLYIVAKDREKLLEVLRAMFESFTKNGRSISRRYIGILRKRKSIRHSGGCFKN